MSPSGAEPPHVADPSILDSAQELSCASATDPKVKHGTGRGEEEEEETTATATTTTLWGVERKAAPKRQRGKAEHLSQQRGHA